MSSPQDAGLNLWDDNPTAEDLLGFDAVVEPILEAIQAPDLDPITIGVQSPWGGGKSTVLNLVAGRLSGRDEYVVIRCDPWQYDSDDNIKQLFIADVLDALNVHFKENAAVGQKIDDLVRRISWSRVALALGKGAFTMAWNPNEIIDAFTPKKRAQPESMSGFRDAFADMLEILPNVQRVVVLVDDLDRCLPSAVMGAMEAIKLFLSAPRMVFALAADQDLIRDAVAAHLANTNRSEAFARRYLEKIVQLPISLPRLSPGEAEAYIALLLAKRRAPDHPSFQHVVDHASARRRANSWPLLSEPPGDAWFPEDDVLRLASQLARGLSADRLSSPRQVKRFLNAFGVRASVAQTRGVTMRADVLVKLLLLEDSHRRSFDIFAVWPAAERQANVKAWEDWAHERVDSAPDGIEESTREWARAEPSLAQEALEPYLRLAATLVDTAFGGALSDQVVGLVNGLLDSAESVRMAALDDVTNLSAAEQAAGMDLLLDATRRVDDLNDLLTSAVRWAARTPALAEQVRSAIRGNVRRLTAGVPPELKASGVPELVELVSEIATSDSAPPEVAEAARIELES